MELIKTFVKDSIQLNIFGTFDEPLFMAQEIGSILKMSNINEQIRLIDSDWTRIRKTDRKGGAREMTFLTEPGLYYLIMRSNKPEAKSFQKWVVAEILPSIRKTGKYEIQHKCSNRLTFKIETEFDLHTKVVSFIKKQYPESLFVVSLGELGVVSDEQAKMLNIYKNNNFKTLMSNDYDQILIQLIDYFKDVRIKCQHCSMKFKTKTTIRNHHKYFHRIE